MGENMNYPENPLGFIKSYSFKDKLGIYTNRSMLVPLFRVEQMIEHYMNDSKNDNCIPVEKIKTIGDFRKVTENLSNDFKLDIKIMKEVPKEELKNRIYQYPWDSFDAELEFQDISYSDKELCIGVYEK